MKALPLESSRTRSEVTKADVEKITVASSDKNSECYLRATRYLIDAHKNPRSMPARSSRWRPFLLRDTRNTFVYCLCVFLGFTFHSRIFHSHGDITFTGEGLQILTNARHSCPLSSEGSLGSLLLLVFTTQVWLGWDSIPQPSACEANALTDCATAAVLWCQTLKLLLLLASY